MDNLGLARIYTLGFPLMLGRHGEVIQSAQQLESSVTSGYGPRVDPVTHQHHTHTGIDIGVPEGVAILAVAPGVVSKIWDNDPVEGNAVMVKLHQACFIGDTNQTFAAYVCLHMSHRSVGVGDEVDQGDVLGYTGSTGRSTGPHLHFQTYDAHMNTFDPRPLFAYMGDDADAAKDPVLSQLLTGLRLRGDVGRVASRGGDLIVVPDTSVPDKRMNFRQLVINILVRR